MATAALLPLAACLTDPSPPTVWPPDDFALQVSGSRTMPDGSRVWQRFQVARDGLACYREAARELPVAALALPVFDSVAVYRLREESVRSLGRMMSRAGVFELDVGQQVNRREDDASVVVAWTANGRDGQVSSLVDSSGVLDRVVHVVNAFLPPSRAFVFPELSGEKEPMHVLRTPEPLASLDGALACHKDLVDLYPDDPELAIDLFALAYVARDAVTARAMFDAIERRGPTTRIGDLQGSLDWEQDCLEPLRALLAEVEGGPARG